MAITFTCEDCGKSYTVSDSLAGKMGQCKQCGHRMTIPEDPESESDGYGLDVVDEGSGSGSESAPVATPLPPRGGAPAAPPRRPLFDPPGASPPRPRKSGFFSGGREKQGLIWVLVVLAGIGLRIYSRWNRAQNRNAPDAQANAFGGQGPLARALVAGRDGPIRLPNFPEPGPGREVEPGVTLREVTLGPAKPPLDAPPGFGGKLWVYTPSGEHAAKSLPCILISGAGSNLLTGMALGDGDRAEHLPYVRAGFAVLAFELDGPLDDLKSATDEQMGQAMFRFLNARAGLVNAHIALEYALAKVPEVDPSRISVAGHSSAAVVAVLFAEHEPRLKACVAFAPALDLEQCFGAGAIAQLSAAGLGDFFTRYAPGQNLNQLRPPLFLFHARDDSNTPVAQSEAVAGRLKALDKPVTLDLVPTGGHYKSMIHQGIPHAIAWLSEQGAGPGK